MKGTECIGCIVCRLTVDKSGSRRGYIAMLAVSPAYRGAGLGTTLVQLALDAMRAQGAALCVLEAEVTNKGALALYEKLNFVRYDGQQATFANRALLRDAWSPLSSCALFNVLFLCLFSLCAF